MICESILKMIDDLNSWVMEKWNLVTHSKKVGSATYNLYQLFLKSDEIGDFISTDLLFVTFLKLINHNVLIGEKIVGN